MIPNESLRLTAELYRELQGCTVDDRCFYGQLPEGKDFGAVVADLDRLELLESSNPQTLQLTTFLHPLIISTSFMLHMCFVNLPCKHSLISWYIFRQHVRMQKVN